MTTPRDKELSMEGLLDRLLGTDLPITSILVISHVITFVWMLYHVDFLAALALTLICSWIVAIPIAFISLLLYAVMLFTALLLEWLQAICVALHSRGPEVR
jgi:hypothetical protein